MEKILFITDGLKLDQNALEFTCYLARFSRSTVTGIFLENVLANVKPVLEKITSGAFQGSEQRAFETKKEILASNRNSFLEICRRNSVRCNVHNDLGIPVSEVVAESRHADLAVVSPNLSFDSKEDTAPSRFVKIMLEEAECPVIIAPESFKEIEEIVFTYNGSASSVFAIKQFTYLFPNLEDIRTIILQVNDKPWTEKEKNNFKGWLENHYSAIGFEVLAGDTETALYNWVQQRENAIVVMGAYGRSKISQFFRRSTAEMLIRKPSQPIFITHY